MPSAMRAHLDEAALDAVALVHLRLRALHGEDADAAAIRRAEAERRKRAQRRSGPPGAYLSLCAAFALTPFQQLCVALALAAELPPGGVAPTLLLASRLYALTAPPPDAEVLRAGGLLPQLFLPAEGALALTAPLRLHGRILLYLCDPAAPAAELAGLAALVPQDLPLPDLRFYGGLADSLLALGSSVFSSPGERPRLLCCLSGPTGSGKRLLARHVTRRAGHPLLEADGDALLSRRAEWPALAPCLAREARLLGAHVSLRFTLAPEEDAPLVRQLLAALADATAVVWLLCEGPWPAAARLADPLFAFFAMEMPSLSHTQRVGYWQSLPGMAGLPVDVSLLASKFAFTPGQMQRAAQDARHLMAAHGHEPTMALTLACRRQLVHNLGKHATAVETPFTWDDLVLPPDRKATLNSICEQVRNRHLVYEDWGFDRRLPYGRGLSVLFTGPPGTGKTMAAQVLSARLGIELYRVELAAVTSKYIGETEKNLELIFQEAGKSRCILFFDEADALFAKRTELKDSNDRFANAESAYLLQRIEGYNGIVLLATNLSQNFDPAFRRRIKFTVEFPLPDQEGRLLIWQKSLAPPTPLQTDVEFAYLAERFPLTGSEIKSIALNAAFLAAEEGVGIGMAHLQRALRQEMTKSGRVLEASLFR